MVMKDFSQYLERHMCVCVFVCNCAGLQLTSVFSFWEGGAQILPNAVTKLKPLTTACFIVSTFPPFLPLVFTHGPYPL